MSLTLPRVIESAAYRSRSGSGGCALTRSTPAVNFVSFGEVVTPPGSAPPVLPLFGRRYHTLCGKSNISLHPRAAGSHQRLVWQVESFRRQTTFQKGLT